MAKRQRNSENVEFRVTSGMNDIVYCDNFYPDELVRNQLGSKVRISYINVIIVNLKYIHPFLRPIPSNPSLPNSK
jgi:hypothetical protein